MCHQAFDEPTHLPGSDQVADQVVKGREFAQDAKRRTFSASAPSLGNVARSHSVTSTTVPLRNR